MSSICFSSIRGLVARATRIDNCGNPIPGTDGYATTCGFTSIGLTAQIDDGEDIEVRNAAGTLLINEPGIRSLTRYDLTVDFSQVDPELFELLAATDIVEDYAGDSVGFQVGEDIRVDGGFALEIWTGISGEEVCDGPSGGAYLYWLVPFVTSAVIGGDITIENGPVSFQLTARTKKNPNWGMGPYDVVAQDVGLTAGPLLTPGVGTDKHLFVQRTVIAPPECVCGYQVLAA